MSTSKSSKISNIVELYDLLPEEERLIVDVLRQIVRETLPDYCKEKISYNVPFFMGTKAFVSFGRRLSRGAVSQKGVLLGFWYGNKLMDEDNYLSRGTNKQIFYKIYQTVEEIDEIAVTKLLKEAVQLDSSFKRMSNSSHQH